jgi:hypothetical protein
MAAQLMKREMVVVAMLLVGCGGHSGPVFEPVRAPTQRFAARAAEVTVFDGRQSVAGESKFDTPIVSYPGQEEARELPLSPELREVLQKTLTGRMSPNANVLLAFDVYVERAEAGFRATWWSEVAFARARISVCILDGRDQAPLTSAFAESWAEVSSLDVADEEPAKLLQNALENAWARFSADDAVIAGANRLLEAREHRVQLIGGDPRCQRGRVAH